LLHDNRRRRGRENDGRVPGVTGQRSSSSSPSTSSPSSTAATARGRKQETSVTGHVGWR